MVVLAVQPAAAQSILRDAETEAVLQEMAEPLVEAAGLQPGNVDIVVIGDNSINAFVAGGQAVYIHSGLILAADHANEVQGVIAHELGHITGGHVVRSSEGIKNATGISILSLILAAGAIAAGGGEAGMGILAAGQRAAIGKYLAFSRVQESSADLAGVQYLSDAGISGQGSINFFKKLQNLEFRLSIPQEDSYDRTHPLSGERITYLQDLYQKDAAWNAPTNPALEAKFQRVKAKLAGYINDPDQTLRDFPVIDQSAPARYARAYAWHKKAFPEKALAETESLLRDYPDDPYFLELEGQIFLESGKVDKALKPLRRATEITNNAPLIAGMFGHALIATEDRSNYPEAERVLRAAVARDNDNPFAWYQLGIVFADSGDIARARLASAERYSMQRQPQQALQNAESAMQGLNQGTPDWIRAQDIALAARSAIERQKDRR